MPLRILHFDANRQDAALVRDQLARGGFSLERLSHVQTPGTFLKALREGAIDLILADYSVAGLDGASALQLARERCPEVPFIFVSGLQLKDTALQALRSGAQDYVPKQRLGRLPAAIRAALRACDERSEQLSADKAIRSRERHLRDVLDLLPHPIFVKDTDGRFVLVNQALADLYDTSVQSIVGKREDELAQPRSPRRLATADTARLLSNRPGHAVLLEEQTDVRGRKRFLQTLKMPFPTNGSGSPGLLQMSVDITDQRTVEDELRLAAVAFDSHNATFITNASGIILKVNQAFTDLTGYGINEALGHSCDTLFRSDRHDAVFFQEQRRALETTGFWQGEIYNRRKSGELFPVWESVTALRDAEGKILYRVAYFQDISERKQVEAHIEHLAYHDPLTHLPNRSLLLDRLQQALARYRRRAQHGALLFLDLDQFKTINDSLGHAVGDLLLCEVARRLSEQIRKEDTVARLGGDEFVILLAQLDGSTDAAAREARLVAEKVHEIFLEDFNIAGYALRVGASVGVAVFPEGDETADEVLRHADIAMYRAKMGGRRAVSFFSPEMQAAATERVQLESQLRQAVERSEFAMHFQPKVDIRSGRILGAEGLLRWNHPQRGRLSPGLFVPVLEESGLIVAVGEWVLMTACQAASAFLPGHDLLRISANLSPRQFHHPGFVSRLRSMLDTAGVRPDTLELELTESIVTRDLDDTVDIMRTLKDIGIRFSLDDFGTGYSSLSYVKRLPLDTLKIDRSFVSDCTADSDNTAIVRAIIAMAKTLDLEVVAEGVETEAQLLFLAEQGCTAYQGYHFSAAVSERDFRVLVEAGR
ncbi:MAG: EAL domain-containing protein [Betaproteobacteria bacterium]|nr:EAL domain-containing protein [Betaproteobacteria bacterium]